jgi:hypothetical protein
MFECSRSRRWYNQIVIAEAQKQAWYNKSDTNLHTVHKTTHRLHGTTATTPSAEYHMQQHITYTPEDGPIDAPNM